MQYCNHCGLGGHSRITSKKCKLFEKYKHATKVGKRAMHKAAQQKRDKKRAHTDKRKASRAACDKRRANTPKRIKLIKECNSKKVSRAIADESKATSIYAAYGRYFIKYATADLAKKIASHVNMSERDVVALLEPLTNKDIISISKNWQNHMTKGANRETCATCGIIALENPKQYRFDNVCINAFKVCTSCTIN